MTLALYLFFNTVRGN